MFSSFDKSELGEKFADPVIASGSSVGTPTEVLFPSIPIVEAVAVEFEFDYIPIEGCAERNASVYVPLQHCLCFVATVPSLH